MATIDPLARPLAHLAAAGRQWPEAWRWYDRFRADKGVGPVGDWPDWCFCPLAGAFAVVSGGGALPSLRAARDVGVLGALAAWRPSQGVYRYDPTLFEAVWTTPLAGELPAEVLYRLPEWCVWIETPGQQWRGAPLHGFFAHLEHDANDGRSELRLVLDLSPRSGDVLVPVPIHLGHGSLAAGVEAAQRESLRLLAGSGLTVDELRQAADDARDLTEPTEASYAGTLAPLVSTVLYLCAEAAEIDPTAGCPPRPERPRPVETRRHGWRLIPPDRPRLWQVGVRLGAAIRRAQAQPGAGDLEHGQRASPRPHVRRAHWHTFLTGPRSADRVPVLRWLPPIPVNLEEEPE